MRLNPKGIKRRPDDHAICCYNGSRNRFDGVLQRSSLAMTEDAPGRILAHVPYPESSLLPPHAQTTASRSNNRLVPEYRVVPKQPHGD